jgi:hypothetical protein
MELALGILVGLVGVLLVLVVLLDIFNSVIVPRPTMRGTLLSRSIIRPGWRAWRSLATRVSEVNKREAMLAIFPPMALVLVLIAWVTLQAIGFGLLIYSLRGDFQPHPRILGSTYVAAASLFGVGQSAFLPAGRAARVVIPIVNATGLGTVALVITFLFSLYANFQRREARVVMLDARAGAPPSGVTLLETYAQLQMLDRLPEVFTTWEVWSAEVLDSHLAYPILTYFRSSHDNESWISALGAILDAATLMVSTIDAGPSGSAKMMVGMGAHLVEDISNQFNLPHNGDIGVEREEFEDARQRLAVAGFTLRDDADSAWGKFTKMRGVYASRLNAMAHAWATPPALWIGDRSTLRIRHPDRGGAPATTAIEASMEASTKA